MIVFSPSLLSSLLILFATQPRSLSAHPQQPPTSTTLPAAVPSLDNNPADGDTVPAAFTPSAASSAVPSATDSAGYGNHDAGTAAPHNGILNYYFLLLAVFVIAMLVIYWSLARRRRKAAAQLRRMQQSVLSEDVRSWTRHRQAGYGFPDEEGRGRSGREEGLDEAGEAPPAYVKEPERAHVDRGEGVELTGMTRLRQMAELGVKPPDYEENPPVR